MEKFEGISINMLNNQWEQIGGDVSYSLYGLTIGKFNKELGEIEVYQFSPMDNGTGKWLVQNAIYNLVDYKHKTLKDFGLDASIKLNWSLIVDCLMNDGEITEELTHEENNQLTPLFSSFEEAYKLVMGDDEFVAWND